MAAGEAPRVRSPIDGRAATVGQDFAAERGRLLPLPAEPFDYSVPARLIGSRVRAMQSANELRMFDGSKPACSRDMAQL